MCSAVVGGQGRDGLVVPPRAGWSGGTFRFDADDAVLARRACATCHAKSRCKLRAAPLDAHGRHGNLSGRGFAIFRCLECPRMPVEAVCLLKPPPHAEDDHRTLSMRRFIAGRGAEETVAGRHRTLSSPLHRCRPGRQGRPCVQAMLGVIRRSRPFGRCFRAHPAREAQAIRNADQSRRPRRRQPSKGCASRMRWRAAMDRLRAAGSTPADPPGGRPSRDARHVMGRRGFENRRRPGRPCRPVRKKVRIKKGTGATPRFGGWGSRDDMVGERKRRRRSQKLP